MGERYLPDKFNPQKPCKGGKRELTKPSGPPKSAMCTVIIKEKLKQSKKDDRETCLPSTYTHTDTKCIAQHVYTTHRYTYIHTPNKQTNIKRMKDKTQAGKRCLLKTCLINNHYLKYRLDSFIIYTFLSVFCLHVCIHAMYV